MATLNLTLEVSPSGNGVINSLINPSDATEKWKLSEVSSIFGDNYEIIEARNNLFKPTLNDGRKCAVFGVDTFGATNLFTSIGGYNGYMFDKKYNTIEFEIDGENIKSIEFAFDKKAQQYAQTIDYLVQGASSYKTVTNTSYTTSFVSNDAPIERIRMTNWANTSYPPCITYINLAPATTTFSKQYIEYFESTIESNSNANNIFYGLLTSTGSISLRDKVMIDGTNQASSTLQSYARNGWLSANKNNIKIDLNGNVIRTHTTDSTPYITDDTIVDISLTDDLAFLDREINFNFQPRMNAFSLILGIMSQAKLSDAFSPSTWTDTIFVWINTHDAQGNSVNYKVAREIREYLINIQIYFINTSTKTTIANILNQFCELTQLNIIVSNDGKWLFKSARPIYIDEYTNVDTNKVGKTKIINIPSRVQISKLTYDLIPKNNIDIVEFSDEYQYIKTLSTTDKKVSFTGNFFLDKANTSRLILVTHDNTKHFEMYDYITETILSDYDKGLYTAQIDIMLGTNLYDYNTKEKVIDFTKGETIQVGDIINLEKDTNGTPYLTKNGENIFFKVVSQTLKFDSQYAMTLKLIQCKNNITEVNYGRIY